MFIREVLHVIPKHLELLGHSQKKKQIVSLTDELRRPWLALFFFKLFKTNGGFLNHFEVFWGYHHLRKHPNRHTYTLS